MLSPTMIFINIVIFLYLIVRVYSSVSEIGGYDERPFDLNLYEEVLDPELCQQQLANMRAFECKSNMSFTFLQIY